MTLRVDSTDLTFSGYRTLSLDRAAKRFHLAQHQLLPWQQLEGEYAAWSGVAIVQVDRGRIEPSWDLSGRIYGEWMTVLSFDTFESADRAATSVGAELQLEVDYSRTDLQSTLVRELDLSRSPVKPRTRQVATALFFLALGAYAVRDVVYAIMTYGDQ